MTTAKLYEDFLLDAFGLTNSKRLTRAGDPAGLADTDKFTNGNIDAVKCAVGYAMAIFASKISEIEEIEDDVLKRIHSFAGNIIATSKLTEIIELIDEYQKIVVKIYFNRSDNGSLTIKQ